jgi:hypothetical protein
LAKLAKNCQLALSPGLWQKIYLAIIMMAFCKHSWCSSSIFLKERGSQERASDQPHLALNVMPENPGSSAIDIPKLDRTTAA